MDILDSSIAYDQVFDTVKAGIMIYDRETRILQANNEALRILHVERDAIIGVKAESLNFEFIDLEGNIMKPDEFPVNIVRKTRQSVDDVTIGIQANDRRIWVLVNGKPVKTRDDSFKYIMTTFIDITGRVEAEMGLKKQQEMFQRIFDNTPVGMCITDDAGYFEKVNNAYLNIYNYKHDEIIGRHFTIVVPEENRDILSKLHDDFIEKGTEIRGEWEVVNKINERKNILADAVRIKGLDDKNKKVTFVMDVTELQHIKEELQLKNELLALQVKKDGLTDVYNHNAVYDKLYEEILRRKRYKQSLSIIMFDLDDFKKINDTYGHQAGDSVLRHFSTILKNSIRATDIPGRYGGEEFLVIMPSTGLNAAYLVAERVRKSSAESIGVDTGIRVTVSGGVVEHNNDDDIIKTINRVDENLYKAKANGKNRIER